MERQAAVPPEYAHGLAARLGTPRAALALQARCRQPQAPQLRKLKVGVRHEGQPGLGRVRLEGVIARRRKVDKRDADQLAWCA